jgi:hypothetical protein
MPGTPILIPTLTSARANAGAVTSIKLAQVTNPAANVRYFFTLIPFDVTPLKSESQGSTSINA